MNSFERYIQVLVCCGGQASCCGAASLSLAPSYLAQSFGDSFLPSPWLLYAFPLLHPSPPRLSSPFHFLPISSNYPPIAVNKMSQNILYFSPFYGWAVWEGMGGSLLGSSPGCSQMSAGAIVIWSSMGLEAHSCDWQQTLALRLIFSGAVNQSTCLGLPSMVVSGQLALLHGNCLMHPQKQAS